MDKEKLINQIMAEAEKDGEPVTREEAEEMAEMEIKANGIKSYTQADKPKKKVQKVRKVDEEKKAIITAIAECLTDTDVQNISVKTETEISFSRNGSDYTVKLIKHRPPK